MKTYPHHDLTSIILKCCFEVLNELGSGFLEVVYKNALVIALRDNNLIAEMEQPIEVLFRNQSVGFYKPDLLVQGLVVVELKSSQRLVPEHQAQVINYLKATGMPVGLLVNFGNQNLEYRRLHHPSLHSSP